MSPDGPPSLEGRTIAASIIEKRSPFSLDPRQETEVIDSSGNKKSLNAWRFELMAHFTIGRPRYKEKQGKKLMESILIA